MKWNEIRLWSNPTTRSPPTVPLPAIKITSGTKAFFISLPANVSYFSWNCRNEICTENISACKLAMTDWKSFNHANCLSVVGGYRKRFEGTLRHMIPMCSASTSFSDCSCWNPAEFSGETKPFRCCDWKSLQDENEMSPRLLGKTTRCLWKIGITG